MDSTHFPVTLSDNDPVRQMVVKPCRTGRDERAACDPQEAANTAPVRLLTFLVLVMTPQPTPTPVKLILHCLELLRLGAALDFTDACLQTGFISSTSPVNCLSPEISIAPGFYLLALQQQGSSWSACILLFGENQALAFIAGNAKNYKTFRYRGEDFLAKLRSSIRALENTDPALFLIDNRHISEALKQLFIDIFTGQPEDPEPEESNSELPVEMTDDSMNVQQQELFRKIALFLPFHPEVEPESVMALIIAHQHQHNPAESGVPEPFQYLPEVDTVDDIFTTTISDGVFIALLQFPEDSRQSAVAMLIITRGTSVKVLIICDNRCHEEECSFEYVVGDLEQWHRAITGIVPHCSEGCTVSLYEKKE